MDFKMKGVEAKRYPVEGVTLQRMAAPQRSQGDGEEQAAPTPGSAGSDDTSNTTPRQTKYSSIQQKDDTPKSIEENDCKNNDERTKSESEEFSCEITPKSTERKTSHSEKSICHKVPKVAVIAKKLSRASIMSTPDDVFLNTPPNMASKRMFQITPKALLNTPQAHVGHRSWTSKSDTISTHKEKEPKFVPYEPYKGCVKPIFKKGKTKKRVEKKDSVGSPQEKDISETNKENETSKGNRSLSVEEVEKKSENRLSAVLKDFEAERVKWEEEKGSLVTTVASQKELLLQCRKEKSQLEDQCTVSAQVNSELKKLLVASVGEDVQGRVQVLTEDKARMATMIRRYSERVEKDFEEKQSMGIQCDVWRSKFLASSMLMDEMAMLKVSMAKQMTEASEALNAMKDEHQAARQHVFNTYKMNKQLRDAFDPLAVQVGGCLHLTSADLVTLALDSNLMAEVVRDHLLGDLGRSVGSQVKVDDLETYTPGEKMARQVLEKMSVDGLAYGSLECSTISPGRVAMMNRFHPNTRTEHLTVNCCAHCNGEITVV